MRYVVFFYENIAAPHPASKNGSFIPKFWEDAPIAEATLAFLRISSFVHRRATTPPPPPPPPRLNRDRQQDAAGSGPPCTGERQTPEPPAAANDGDTNPVGDDSASPPTATVDQTEPETPLVVLGNEGVARVPELAAAVAVFTAGLGLFPVTLPTELDTATPRRRRSA